MYKNLQKIIFYSLVSIISFFYLLPEISLLVNSIRYNGFSTFETSFKHVNIYKSQELDLRFNIPQNTNFSKSYIAISGSNYLTDTAPESYISFLDKMVILKTVPLTSSSIKRLSDSELLFFDKPMASEGMTIIIELFLVDNNGNTFYDWQIASFSNSYWDIFLSRYSYLVQYLIWIFAIFGSVITKKVFSTIYNSVTKKPVSGAVVRVFKDNSLYSTVITSVTGIINIKLKKGKYRIELTKPGYIFPSKLSPQKIDGLYTNLYYGKEFNVYKNSDILKMNIPIDPESNINKIQPTKIVNLFTSTVEYFNPQLIAILAISQIIVWPNYLESYVFGFIGTFLFSIQYFIKKLKNKKPGIVLDNHGKFVPLINVNLYEKEWNKLITRTQTNEKGEYEFIVTPNNYFIKIESSKYSLTNSQELLDIPKSNEDTMYINKKIIVDKLPTSRTTTTTTTSSTKTNTTPSS